MPVATVGTHDEQIQRNGWFQDPPEVPISESVLKKIDENREDVKFPFATFYW